MSNARDTAPSRIHSLDQFRGYSVAAMFVVNFLGGLAVTHPLLRHNNTHFSFADSIMPSFIFACGFSYRLSVLKQLQGHGVRRPGLRYLKRSFGLILLSLMLFGFGKNLGTWSEFTAQRMVRFFFELVKADLWEVLAIIGALQILLLPLIAKAAWIRTCAWILLGVTHLVLSWSFNYNFVYGLPNGIDAYFGAQGKRAWDGGCFGLLAWAQIMLAGTLAQDAMQAFRMRTSIQVFLAVGILLMLTGYGLSCMTRLYDLKGHSAEQIVQWVASPVVPDLSAAQDREWRDLLAEPPFVAPPPPSERALNYWMMDKRIVSQSFVLFSTGFALTLFAAFVVMCDLLGITLAIFEMFGKNPLAAYIINHLVNHSILGIVPKDAPLSWVLFGLATAFAVTTLFVRHLDSHKLTLRL